MVSARSNHNVLFCPPCCRGFGTNPQTQKQNKGRAAGAAQNPKPGLRRGPKAKPKTRVVTRPLQQSGVATDVGYMTPRQEISVGGRRRSRVAAPPHLHGTRCRPASKPPPDAATADARADPHATRGRPRGKGFSPRGRPFASAAAESAAADLAAAPRLPLPLDPYPPPVLHMNY